MNQNKELPMMNQNKQLLMTNQKKERLGAAVGGSDFGNQNSLGVCYLIYVFDPFLYAQDPAWRSPWTAILSMSILCLVLVFH